MDKPTFVDTVTQIPADFLNLVTDVIFGPLNQATTVPGVLSALGVGTLAAQNTNAVEITGGTLDGVAIGNTTQATGKFSSLFNYATPTDPNHAANKAYVDAQIAGAGLNPSYVALNYLALAGGVMTGALTLPGAPTMPLHAATKQYVDTVAQGFVTTASLNEALGSMPSATYVNALIAQQAARELYHDTFPANGQTNVFTLRNTAAGDVLVFDNGVPVPRNKVSTGSYNSVILTYNPVGTVDALYYGITGSGTSVTGLLLLSGGTMTGPLMLARDPQSPLEAATKEYVDSKATSGYTIGAGLTLTGDTLSASMLSVAGRRGDVTLTVDDVANLATVAKTGSYADLSNKPIIPPAYTLPPATTAGLGGVIVGTGLVVDVNGVLSSTVVAPSVATTSSTGVVKVGAMLGVTVDGTLSVTPSTAVNIISNAAEGVICVNEWWSAAAWVNLGNVSGTVTLDGSVGQRFYGTLIGNVQVNTTNLKNGQSIQLALMQDATGGHTVAYASNIKFVNGQPTVSTAPSTNALYAKFDGTWTNTFVVCSGGAFA